LGNLQLYILKHWVICNYIY